MMSLSIVIPMYNREKYIGFCLDSIFSQNADLMLDVIVVDDGSTDRSCDIVREMMKEHTSNLRLILLEGNRGVSIARNAGMQAARGDYIWFVDSDDFLARGSLAVASGLISNHRDVDIIMFKMQRFTRVPENYFIGDFSISVPSIRIININVCRSGELIKFASDAVACNVIYSRMTISRIAWQPYPNGEDMLFSMGALMIARWVLVCDAALYGYRIGHASASSQGLESRFFSLLETTLKSLECLTESTMSVKHKRALSRHLCSAFYFRAFGRYRVSDLTARMCTELYDTYRTLFVMNNYRSWYRRICSALFLRMGSRSLFYGVYRAHRSFSNCAALPSRLKRRLTSQHQIR